MTKEQLFNAFNLSIGLLANLLSIGLFVAGLWSGDIGIPSSSDISIAYFLLSALIICYSLFYISYITAIKKIRQEHIFQSPLKERVVKIIVSRTVQSMAILFAPVTILWVILLFNVLFDMPASSNNYTPANYGWVIAISMGCLFGAVGQSVLATMVNVALSAFIPVIHEDILIEWDRY